MSLQPVSHPDSSTNDELPKTEQTIRIGMIGLDTSHVPAFVRLMNSSEETINGIRTRIVAAVPAGNPDFPLSRNRVAGFTSEVREQGVQIVDSLDDLLPLVDGVMVQSVDGRQHLQQARRVFEAGKPVFIDKPLAASLQDVKEIASLGKRFEVPWFTASAMRFTGGYPELRNNSGIGRILGCDVYGQCKVMPGHPDLFWYGVHAADLLYSLMGAGCESVTAVQTEYTEQVTGIWEGGRIGTFRGIREDTGKPGWGVTVFGTSDIRHVSNTYDYEPLVGQISRFFCVRQSPVPVDEMVEVFAFLSAAEQSRELGGVPVRVCR